MPVLPGGTARAVAFVSVVLLFLTGYVSVTELGDEVRARPNGEAMAQTAPAPVISSGVLSASWKDDAAHEDEPRSPLRLRFGDDLIRERVMAVSVMPGESVPVSIGNARSVEVTANAGEAVQGLGNQWLYHAPDKPGTARLTVRDTERDASLQLHIFVLKPWDHRGTSIEGYRIGRYQSEARGGLETYERPRGFVRVTETNRDVRVSPNFRLAQFLCKQQGGTTEFALLDTKLIQALEDVLAAVREKGHDAATLHVMSGFRTPFYNRAIGNTTIYSRHLYGDAADVFVDVDNDGRMDDLNRDGRVTEADARYLADIIESAAGEDGTFIGGLGTYGPASHRGPFVHLDFRGYTARW
ncbi:hypothetical protein CRI94_13450 [Longibacter salinarum]|uniref:Peptidase M15A C-terminal domain-containing protein n=1 Tax=Longibacter salinarum TaxID=1850348 RepID=A0A2A8CVA1_9BACT|nr:D-Ala-D-Ala carboxypeptidase family metallohydrolase [Longibacter salinarum]PEN12527.1 hypothetical protein CRI94_13450 [Longibacter salinarum]